MTAGRFRIALFGVAALAAAQTSGTDSLRFEVAALKPSLANQQGGIIRPSVGNAGYHGENLPLRAYLMIAFTVRDTEISGAPSWFGEDRYDLEAKAEKQSTVDELHIMLRNLLVDRCQLKYHIETKEQSGFALMVDKGGAKLTEHDPNDRDYPPIRPMGPGKIQATNAAMSLFVLFLSRALDRPVVDKTGLTAHYDFKLEFAPQLPPGADAGEAPLIQGPSPFDALKDQLGLRLEPAKAPTQRVIIDHIEKPSGN